MLKINPRMIALITAAVLVIGIIGGVMHNNGGSHWIAPISAAVPLAPEGDWLRRILASESMTIAGGTSAVQRNMIGERILGLPKG